MSYVDDADTMLADALEAVNRQDREVVTEFREAMRHLATITTKSLESAVRANADDYQLCHELIERIGGRVALIEHVIAEREHLLLHNAEDES